jgi:hypothetical protein
LCLLVEDVGTADPGTVLKAADEATAAKEAEAKDPVLRLRGFLQGGRSPENIAAEVKALSVEGGLAGQMRVLYEVSTNHCT